MAPKLALMLCIAFVLFLLRLERKQVSDVTGALWIPTIWIMLAASKPLAVWFPLSGATPESSPLDLAFLVVLMCLALGILIRRRFDWVKAIKENAGLIVMVSFMLISIFWSDIPYISFKRWIRELQAILMAFIILSEPSPRQAIESIIRRIAYILIPFSLLLIKYFPKYGRVYGRYSGQEMWIGVTEHKNGLGIMCLITAFFFIWSLLGKWQRHNKSVLNYQTYAEIFILALILWLMKGPGGSYSATSITTLVVGILVYWGFHIIRKSGRNVGAGMVMTITAILNIFGIVTFFTGGSSVGIFASTAGRDTTLTGRTGVWAALLPISMQKPLLGRGFGSFWTPITKKEFDIPSAHNGYLEVLLGLGFVGIFLVAIFLFSSCRKAQRELSNNFDWGTLWICFLIMALVYNITESSIDTLTSPLTAIILFFSVFSRNFFSNRQQLQ
ncbi:MAG: O-antigen ligase family protein [Candidatus Helarchaeota archaeon]|nr:O-antigen ligase family protein [Candidatus Helarchaeota archaeon]